MNSMFISEITKQDIKQQLVANKTYTDYNEKNKCFFNSKSKLAQCNFVVKSYTNNTQIGTAEISYRGIVYSKEIGEDEQSAVFKAIENLFCKYPEILN